MIQLNRLNWRDYVRHANPLATALMARMHVVPRDRRQVKLESLSHLAGLPITNRRKRMLGAFTSIYLPLKPHEETLLREDLERLSPAAREDVMELISEWELRGIEKGHREGA